MAARRDQTMKSGWDGDLMDLQNETQKLLATVRSTPSRSRSTKNSERKGSRVDDGLGKKKKKRKQKTTTEEKKTSSFKTTLDLGRETVEILDTASNPVSARSSDGEDELDLKQTRGVGTTVRFQQTKQEITSRNLDFETEKSRVSEVFLYLFMVLFLLITFQNISTPYPRNIYNIFKFNIQTNSNVFLNI